MVGTEYNQVGIQLTDGANMDGQGQAGVQLAHPDTCWLKAAGHSDPEMASSEQAEGSASCWPCPGLAQGLLG